MNWIATKDKLPDERVDVWICTKYGMMAYTHYRVGEDWYGYGQSAKTYHVTAWMPCPEPYKEQEKEPEYPFKSIKMGDKTFHMHNTEAFNPDKIKD